MVDPMNPGGAAPGPEGGVQIRRLLLAAERGRFKIFISTLVGLILGAFVSALIPDQFRSRTLLLVRERPLFEDSRLIKAISEKPLVQKEATLAEEIRGFKNVIEVIQQNEWREYAEFRNDQSRLTELVEKVRNAKRFEVSVDNDPSGELLVQIAFKWYDAETARRFVDRVRRNWIKRREDESKEYVRKQLADAQELIKTHVEEYETARAALENFQRENRVITPEDSIQDNAVKQSLLIRKDTLLQVISDGVSQTRSLQEELSRTPRETTKETQEKNPEYEAKLAALTIAKAELAQLETVMTPVNPQVKIKRAAVEKAQKEFDAVKDQSFAATTKSTEPNPIWSDLQAQLTAKKAELDGAREQLTTLDASLAAVDKRLNEYPTLISNLRKLQGDFALAEEVLRTARTAVVPLEDRLEHLDRRSKGLLDPQAALEASGAISILEDPVAARKPEGLPKPVIALIGLVVGLMFGLAFAVFKELSRVTYDDPTEVSRNLGLPILGSVARIATPSELRRARVRRLSTIVGGLLVVASLGGFVYLVTSEPARLPVAVQDAMSNLRALFQ